MLEERIEQKMIDTSLESKFQWDINFYYLFNVSTLQ